MTMPSSIIETVEMHTGGEPVRIVVAGYPEIPGDTILAKRRHAREHLDRYRRMLIFEPRGHYDMYGVIPVVPDHPKADLAVLFMHNEGYSTMCGHATIAIGRWAVDAGLVARETPETRFNLQVPCGLVRVSVEVHGEATRFESVPAFAAALDRLVEVPGIGKVRLDVGYGGAFYALVPADTLGLDLKRSSVAEIVARADAVTQATKAQVPLTHPDDPDLAFLYGTIVTDGHDAFGPTATRNVCVFAEREVDRSPTGSGVTARIAVQHAKGLIALGQERKFESLTDAIFTGKATATTKAGNFDAVTVEVGGRAHYTGTARFAVEPDDMLGGGFLLR
jgi:proline racemase